MDAQTLPKVKMPNRDAVQSEAPAFIRGEGAMLKDGKIPSRPYREYGLKPHDLGVDAESCHAARDDPWYITAVVNNREAPKMNKKTVTKAKARLKKAKVKLAALQRRARKEVARIGAALKRHQRALKAATRSYKKARQSA
jgi:hypothetical protein